MIGYYVYRYLLPVIIGILVLCIFQKLKKNSTRFGWRSAFLIFGICLVMLLPMKANPFDSQKLAHDKSALVLKQIKGLTIGGFFLSSDTSLAEDVTDKTINDVEKQLNLVDKKQQESAKKDIEKAWEFWYIKETEDFFSQHLGWQKGNYFQYPEKETIDVDSLEQATNMLDNIKDMDTKQRFENYLNQTKEIINN